MIKPLRAIIYSLVIILVIWGIYSVTSGIIYKASDDGPGTAYRLDEARLGQRLGEIVQANRDLNMSVSIIDLQTGRSYHYGETASYTAASITKLITAAAYLQKIETGQAHFTDQVGNAEARQKLKLLIVKSDNTAWHELNTIITPEGLNAYAQALGFNSYNPEKNVITSDDVSLLLYKLASQKLLDNANTGFLLSLMAQANYRDYMVAAVPADTNVYHKVGYLDDRLHEAALIKKGDRSFALTVFSKSNQPYLFSRGAAVFKDIARETQAVFLQ